MKILIAAFTKANRLRIKETVHSVVDEGRIFEAQEVKSAIEIIIGEYPDVIVMDMHFSDGSGFDLLDYIYDHDLEIFLIVLADFDSPKQKNACYEKGAHYCFDKYRDYEMLPMVLEEYA
jgi:DNA-binding NarL/FixJ family response regulator